MDQPRLGTNLTATGTGPIPARVPPAVAPAPVPPPAMPTPTPVGDRQDVTRARTLANAAPHAARAPLAPFAGDIQPWDTLGNSTGASSLNPLTQTAYQLSREMHTVTELQSVVDRKRAAFELFMAQNGAALEPAARTALQERFDRETPERTQLAEARRALGAHLQTDRQELVQGYAAGHDRSLIEHALHLAHDPAASVAFIAELRQATPPVSAAVADHLLAHVASLDLRAMVSQAIATGRSQGQNAAQAVAEFQRGPFGEALRSFQASGSQHAGKILGILDAFSHDDPLPRLRALHLADHPENLMDRGLMAAAGLIGLEAIPHALDMQEFKEFFKESTGAVANVGMAIEYCQELGKVMTSDNRLRSALVGIGEAGSRIAPFLNIAANGTGLALDIQRLLEHPGDGGRIISMSGQGMQLAGGLCGLAELTGLAAAGTLTLPANLMFGLGFAMIAGGNYLSDDLPARQIRNALGDTLRQQVPDARLRASLASLSSTPTVAGLGMLGYTPDQVREFVSQMPVEALTPATEASWLGLRDLFTRPDGQVDTPAVQRYLSQSVPGQQFMDSPFTMVMARTADAHRAHPHDPAASARQVRQVLEEQTRSPFPGARDWARQALKALGTETR